MFKHILVPVDFSSHSQEALRTAVDLAGRYDASLSVIHVVEPPSYALPPGYTFFTPQQLSDIHGEVEKLVAAAKRDAETAGARRVATKVLQGAAASAITEFARDSGTDLIVMGTRGRTGIPHVLLGSVAERVLSRAPCPVLTVKAAETATVPRAG